jgi:hypothetical protein
MALHQETLMNGSIASSLAILMAAATFVTTAAQAPAPAAPAPALPGAAPAQGPGRAGGAAGGGRGGGRGGMTPSALRAAPAETQAAKVKDPNWKAPRTAWGHPDIEGIWTSDDMLSVPVSRGRGIGARETLTPEEFAQRASGDEGQKFRAVNQETILRNERGVRTFGYTSMVIDPPTGIMPPMTEAGRARAAKSDRGTFGTGPFDGFDDFTLYDRCVTRGILGSTLPVIYGNGMRIMQTPNDVVISYEMIHDTRVIPLDGRPQLNPALKQYLGSSRARWDGDTLVIETTNLTDKTSIGSNGNGTRHSDRMKLTEWFTRVDPQMVEYKARVEDPVAYTAPFTIRMMITQQPDYEIYEYACHEGNGAVGYALSADRAFDRRVEEAKAKGLPIPQRDMSSPYGPPVEGLEIIQIR